MCKAFRELTCIVEQAAERLRADYDVEQLHDLRVTIRRIRSLLKQHGKRRARRWGRIWGSFARVTGRSRDWDVFLESAGALLPPPDAAHFQALCRARLESSRAAVRALLESPAWRQYLGEWKTYAMPRPAPREEKPGRAAVGRTAPAEALKPALSRANRALAEALALPDDSGWHRFRIAVKELRYVAEQLPAHGASAIDPQAVSAACKSLQSPLGDWHDCIVQAQLLDELERGTTAGDPVLSQLRAAIEALRRQRLTEIREALDQQSLLQSRNGFSRDILAPDSE